MAKEDFCFTYYDGDAARDKAHMNRLERGAYDDIISAQRKRGHLSLSDIKKVLGNDFDSCWGAMEWILKMDSAGLFFIEWVDASIEKMKINSAKQKEKAKKRWGKDAAEMPQECHGIVSAMPLEDENGNGYEKVNDEKGVQGEKQIDEFLWTSILKNFGNDFRWKEKFCRDKDVGLPALETKMQEFVTDIELKQDYKPLKELQSHFVNWYNKNKTINNGKIHRSGNQRKPEFEGQGGY